MTDPRDEIWSAVYRLWYDTEYDAELADRMVSRWQGFDDVVKVMVSLTASGSVIAGWALWSSEGFKYMWALLAGTGALLSIVSSALGVPERLKSWSQSKGDFRVLAIQCQALRLAMRVNPEFDVAQVVASFEDLHKRFGEAVGRMRNDFLATKQLRQACQAVVTAVVQEEVK